MGHYLSYLKKKLRSFRVAWFAHLQVHHFKLTEAVSALNKVSSFF